MYFGCHNGSDCQCNDLLVEGNFINGVDSSAVGYGIEVKLNSVAIIRDNTFYDTKGPCLMVYGSDRGDPACLIEGNYLQGSKNDAGINVGGGPVIVRNNIAVANKWGGIVAQDYNGRNLMDDVWIVHNTVLANSDSGITLQNWQAGRGNLLAYNAIGPLAATSPIHPANPEGNLIGNQICTSFSDCWVDPQGPLYDLWPVAAGPLVDTAGNGAEAWRPVDDFMGVNRGNLADIGALERTPTGNGPQLGDYQPRPERGSQPQTDGGLADADGQATQDGSPEDGDAGTEDVAQDGNDGSPPTDQGDSETIDAGVIGDKSGSISGGCGCHSSGPTHSSGLATLLIVIILFSQKFAGRSTNST